MLQLELLVEALESVCLEEGLAVIATTPEGRIRHWSRGAAEVYGYPCGHTLDEPVTMLAAPTGFGQLVDMIAAARAGAPTVAEPTVHLRADGVRIPVRLNVGSEPGEGLILTARRCVAS
ncbi:MAG TPA: PAS domain S-box protein [Tepidiformaceae bacterium]|nr:PAS domain S-box protein [Tepidiformaceae bacterium]